jgi:para-nitrobenzyl esterase
MTSPTRAMNRRLRQALAIALSIALAHPAAVFAAPADAAVVQIPGGTLRGIADADGLVFKRIPYAAPPVGALRWRPPVPVTPWQGVRAADQDGPACLQNDEGWNHASVAGASEDCLTLDVRTPAAGAKLPVMVWIHGGSNRAGSGAGAVESTIARHGEVHGLVVVSVQYRLGVFGFVSTRALATEQGGTTGNYGLMDQIAALRWVRANIARFGGDPARVTIFGESAGAQDVSLLLAAPSAQGLFRAAIMQSGTPGFGMTFRPLDQALSIGDQLDRLGHTHGDLAQLRAVPARTLLALQSQLTDPAARGNAFLFLRTTIDGAVLPAAPDTLIAARPPLPVIIGTNRIEFGPGPGGADLPEFARFWFGDRGDAALAAYRDEDRRGTDPRRGNIELRIETDAQFHCPANRMATVMMAHGWPVWRYEFDMAPDGGPTRHALDVGYVFGGKGAGTGPVMQDYWIGLARDLDPDGQDAKGTRWAQSTTQTPRTMQFNQNGTALVSGWPRQTFCGFAGNW